MSKNYPIFQTGAESYDNQLKYGEEVFMELKNIQDNGFQFEGIHHDIRILSCCDWKAGACIEGFTLAIE